MNLTEEQEKYLDYRIDGSWKLNPITNLIDIKGNFAGRRSNLDFKILQFGTVTGFFSCAENNLTSLAGAPTEVGSDFICEQNNLTNLIGVPQIIGGNLFMDKIPSIKGLNPLGIKGKIRTFKNAFWGTFEFKIPNISPKRYLDILIKQLYK